MVDKEEENNNDPVRRIPLLSVNAGPKDSKWPESQKEEYLKDIDNDYIRHFYSCSKFKYVFMACCLTISVRYYIKLLKFL